MADKVKTVFILGAGASKLGGAPLMRDFLSVSRDLYARGIVDSFKTEFQLVYEGINELTKSHSKSQLDIQNVESVFTAFELGKLLGRLGSFNSEKIESLTMAMRTLIVGTIENTLFFPIKGNKVAAPAPYPTFATLLSELVYSADPKHELSIITFNYDLAIDVAIDQIFNLDYGLASLNGEGFPLLKLHGSLNWAQEIEINQIGEDDYEAIETGNIIPVYIRDYRKKMLSPGSSKRTDKINLQIGSQISELAISKKGLSFYTQPIIVPPTWNKTDYQFTLRRVWQRAAKELSDAENIIVIGYSLPATDEFFKFLYALGTVGDTVLRRFWVFNPNKTGEVETRFKQMLGPGARQAFAYHQHKFSGAVQVLSQEFLRTQIK